MIVLLAVSCSTRTGRPTLVYPNPKPIQAMMPWSIPGQIARIYLHQQRFKFPMKHFIDMFSHREVACPWYISKYLHYTRHQCKYLTPRTFNCHTKLFSLCKICICRRQRGGNHSNFLLRSLSFCFCWSTAVPSRDLMGSGWSIHPTKFNKKISVWCIRSMTDVESQLITFAEYPQGTKFETSYFAFLCLHKRHFDLMKSWEKVKRDFVWGNKVIQSDR